MITNPKFFENLDLKNFVFLQTFFQKNRVKSGKSAQIATSWRKFGVCHFDIPAVSFLWNTYE